jgi:hypothetical protein
MFCGNSFQREIVGRALEKLVSAGEIERRGNGSLSDPHLYYPIPLRRQE